MRELRYTTAHLARESGLSETTVRYLNSQELHQTGEETAGQQLTRSPDRRSGRPDATILTWEDPTVIPSDA
jgi:hypothetical protein